MLSFYLLKYQLIKKFGSLWTYKSLKQEEQGSKINWKTYMEIKTPFENKEKKSSNIMGWWVRYFDY